jgi:membrane-associated phospholipid phosphatase
MFGAAVARVLLVASLVSPIQDLDRTVQERVQAMRHPVLEPFMRGLTQLGESRNVMGVLLGFACFGGAQGPALVRRILTVLLPVNIVVEVTRLATGRTRPDGDSNPRNASFPSGHAANAAGFAYVLATRWRRPAVGFWAFATAVSFSRMYLNRHFLSDVVIGMALGIVIAWLVLRLVPGWRDGWPAQPPRRPARRE